MTFPAKLQRAVLPDFLAAFRRLEPDAPGRWGGLDASSMLAHLTAALELSLGEREARALVPAWIGRPAGWLAMHVFPRWPRGRKGSTPPLPHLFPAPQAFDAQREHLEAALERFVDRLEREPEARATNPLMGDVSMRTWSRLHALHCRHHLRQFGALSG